MSDNHWVTNIYNGVTPPSKGGGLAVAWWWIWRGTLFLVALRWLASVL